MKELKALTRLIEDIEYLKKKSELCDKFLSYYDYETMTFNIPDKWKGDDRYSDEIKRQIPKSPKHKLNKIILETLGYSEAEQYINWGEVNRTLLD